MKKHILAENDSNKHEINISIISRSPDLFKEWVRYAKLINAKYASWLDESGIKPSISRPYLDKLIIALNNSGIDMIGGYPEIKVIVR